MGSRLFSVGRGVAAVSAVAAATVVAALQRVAVVEGPLFSSQELKAAVGMAAIVIALVAAGVLLFNCASIGRPDALVSTGLVGCLAASTALGWSEGPAWLRSAGGVVAPLLGTVALVLVGRRLHRVAAATWWMLASVGAVSFAVFAVRDPFHDPSCRFGCELEGVAPLASRGAAKVLTPALETMTWLVAVLCLILAVIVVVDGASARWHRRLLDGVLCVGAALIAVGGAAAQRAAARDSATALLWLAPCGLALVAMSIALQSTVVAVRRRRLHTLAVDLGDVPPLGTLEHALSRALGDRDVRVAYWLPASSTFVDAAGEAIPDAAEWPVTLQREGAALAAVWLSDRDRDVFDLERLLGTSARLAIDSERLQAEHRAQLRDLRASRQRIVATSDEIRRRVERSIHDVVQAELLAALYDVALVSNQAERTGDIDAANALRGIGDDVRRLVVTIREFAHGIYPAVLDSSGLCVAIDALADAAPVSMAVDRRIDGPIGIDAERTAYLLVEDAVGRATSPLTVYVGVGDETLSLVLQPYPGTLPEHLRDRIGALGGSAMLAADTMTAVVPCG